MELTEREEEQDILFGVINRFIGYFTREAVPRTTNDTTTEYPFVAMDTRQAYEQIRIATKYLKAKQRDSQSLSFLDIGCGIGNILLLAELMECTVCGIEKDEASYSIAKNLVGEESVTREDIWQFERWADFDIVYYFRPFSEKNKQLKFEKLVEDKMQVGAILIGNRRMGFGIDEDMRFKRLVKELPVWEKLSD